MGKPLLLSRGARDAPPTGGTAGRSCGAISGVFRVALRANRVENVPTEGWPWQDDWGERPAVRFRHVVKALRLTSHNQQKEARSRAAELSHEGEHLVVVEIIGKEDRSGRGPG